jgi:hypothetical protein
MLNCTDWEHPIVSFPDQDPPFSLGLDEFLRLASRCSQCPDPPDAFKLLLLQRAARKAAA